MAKKRIFSFVLVLSIILSSIGIISDSVEAVEASQYKRFHSIDRGNIKAQGEGYLLGYIDRKVSEKNRMITTRIKQDENNKPAYCLNYSLDSPKFNGNEFKRTNEKLNAKEYTALMYGYGGPHDKTDKSLTLDERYYISQVAMYAITNETPEITKDNLSKHIGNLVDSNKSELILNNINKLIKEINENTLTLPEEGIMPVEIKGQVSPMKVKGHYLESEKIQIINSNPEILLTIDKKDLGSAYFVDISGNKVDDHYVLAGNEFKLRIDIEDIAKSGRVGFTVSGRAVSLNPYKYIQRHANDSGVNGKKIQKIAWLGETNNTFSDSIFIEYNGIKRDIELTKTDYNGKLLDGVEFELLDEEGNKIQGPIETNNGKLVFKDIPLGKYNIVETNAPKGYVLNNEKILVEVNEASKEPIKINIKNRPIIGGIEITKLDTISGEKLSNAKFQIKNENNEVIGEGVTDDKGIVRFDKLPYGKYTYREIEAPKGYIIDREEHHFEIKEDGKILKAEVKNKKAEKAIDLHRNTNKSTKETVPLSSNLEKNTAKEMERGHLPKTGTLDNSIFYLLGLIFIGVGVYFRRKYL
ncbi:thioester domain-containing protein [Anaerosalibacter bizertensis]|uniref:Cys-Gln thioester bond-forming surface protein n=3 Tax=Anaerosalibacter bizertensis TaxID=932217 RepID=A0A9Q4FMK2_9FIRM|nr:thioester domain-containing protein [Anaerosalibacter bizertensis]MBV1819559.1 Cys-Gln thioester bond-forming surface protein [Bacteroidales bacterium MSK.15.36]MCG4565867.1 Cys-Gln thioester bond-forming surface protein [Anaerosalibacter bizertensis]